MSATPYSDSHAEKVSVVADTYDPSALVVPHRKAMNLEIERDSACSKLREIADWFSEVQHFERAAEIYGFLRNINTANKEAVGHGPAAGTGTHQPLVGDV